MPGEKDKETAGIAPSQTAGMAHGHHTTRLPPDLGAGTFVTHCLDGGVELTFSNITLAADLDISLTESGENAKLVFCLGGRSMNRNAYFKNGFEMNPGSNCLYWSPEPGLVRQAPSGAVLKAMVISFPRSRLRGEGDLPGIGLNQGHLSRHPNSPLMNLVLRQIQDCGLTGQTQRFFLESKALELMALKMALMDHLPQACLSPEQRRGVETVRNLLLKHIQNPPSIHFLARAAGMSHPLLNRCFKKAYGCTAFEFLRHQRLQISQRMVVDTRTRMCMTEIAHAAGYASSSHFSRAFSAEFGMPPDRYRKAAGSDQR